MTKIKSWTIFILLTLTLITLLIAPITVWYNLKHYSVYYAQHIPHKEEENPELVFIIENLIWIKAPTNLNLEYEDLNHRIHILFDSEDTGFRYAASLQRDWLYENHIRLFYYKKESYIWGERGEFKYYSRHEQADKHLTTDKYKLQANKELDSILKPIVNIQPEPKLNLQWLFNWVHRDRFNQD